MLKLIFLFFVIIHFVLIGVWGFKFPISYKFTNGTYSDIIVDHDFSNVERESIEKAFVIRKIISNLLLYYSLALTLLSFVIFHRDLIMPNNFVRIVMYFSSLITLLLIIISKINFIPGSPIR